MKKYDLVCPVCGTESIFFYANEPDEALCWECKEAVDIEKVLLMPDIETCEELNYSEEEMKKVERIVDGWSEYLADRKQYLDSQGGKSNG